MSTSPRSLRVGIVISGRLVEERLFDARTPVTFGQALRCQLSVPVAGVPREHVLFARHGGRVVLHVPPGMTGRLVAGGREVDVRGAGEVDVRGTREIDVRGAGEVALAPGVRGKLELGDVTLLIQDVETPAPAPRMQLPAALRDTLADRIDRRLALIIGGSLVAHTAIATWAWTGDVGERTFGVPAVATTYHQDVIDVSVPDDITEPTPIPVGEPGAAPPIAPTQTTQPIVQRPRITARPDAAVDVRRLASLLTGSDGAHGVAGMRPRQPGAELGKQIDEARDSNATIGDGSHTSRIDDRARIGTVDTTLAGDPILARVPGARRDEPTGRIIAGVVVNPDTTTLTPDLVLDRVNTVYMAGLQRCYRLGLAIDAELSGRVALGFTVDERGKVIDADATGMSSQVDACITKQMGTWRFPIPKDKDGDPTDAPFEVTLALQPS